MKTRKYISEVHEAVHSTVAGMYKGGTVDEVTMRRFDASCLVPPTLEPKQIKKLRERLKVSQPALARHLNTSESTIEKWESGAKKPSGMALKLLSVVDKHGLEVLA